MWQKNSRKLKLQRNKSRIQKQQYKNVAKTMMENETGIINSYNFTEKMIKVKKV